MTLLLQTLEASHKNTGHRVMFLLTKYVQIQLILTRLVSDLICQGLGCEAPSKKMTCEQTSVL